MTFVFVLSLHARKWRRRSHRGEERAQRAGPTSGSRRPRAHCWRSARAQRQALCPKGHLVAFQSDSLHVAGALPITGPVVRTQRVLNPLLPEPSSAPGWPLTPAGFLSGSSHLIYLSP